MILFDLSCKNNHLFEAWFPSSDKFEEQNKKGQIKCPYCNTSSIKKSLMAPNIKVSKDKKYSKKHLLHNKSFKEVEKKIKELKKYINKNSENVGKNFAEEARKIYYGEAKERSIRGETTKEEAKDLLEEGVPFSRLPWGTREDA